MTLRFSSLSAWLLLLAANTYSLATDAWTSFHNGGNTSIDAGDLSLSWTPQQGIAWKAELSGYGQSCPVVWQDCVYVTAVRGDEKQTCIVAAYCASTGKELWKHELPATVSRKTSYMVSRAAPTPLIDTNALYTLFESGDLYALAHDGQLRWHVALFDEENHRFQNAHGYGASPAQTEDAIIVLIDHRGPSYLTALSKESGQALWTTERTSRSSWSSPHVTRVGERTQVVVSSGGTVDGYDAQTGQQLWSHGQISGNLIPSATVCGSHVYVGASVERNDTNAGSAAASNLCLRIAPSCKAGYEVLWQADRAVCYYVSPLVHRGFAYYLNNVGVLYCLDTTTGRQVYAKRIGTTCWAQPIAVEDRLYFFGKNGETIVLRAGPAFERIASNRLWDSDNPPLPRRTFEYEPEGPNDPRPREPRQEYLDPIVYGVAAVDGAFFVRLGTHLYCIRDDR